MRQESDFLASQLIVALKELLRQRQVGYQRIAEAMELSLPTVKRMLNRSNLPLDRLLTICSIAGIKPGELFAAAERNQPRHTLFTKEQDDLFFERPEFLSYFLRLATKGDSPDEIEKSEKLSPLSTARYLKGLERVDLLEREPGNQVKLKVCPPYGFGPESRVLRTQHVVFLKETVEAVFSPEAKDVFALLKPLRLHHDSFTKMLSELTQIVDKYSFLSENPTSRTDECGDWRLSVAAGPSSIGQEEAAIVELEG